jgi:Helix-turn-helix domain
MDATDETPRKQQAVNLRALQWAYEQEGLNVTSKAVLLTFAIHANDRGYSWPGVDHIASTWRMDRKTVRRQIEQLIASRKIFRTKKRCGYTGQVKVYRLPKITWGSGGKSTRLQDNESGAKESLKSPISGGEFPPNKGIKEYGTSHDDMRAHTTTRETAAAQSANKKSSSSDLVSNLEEAEKHPLWPEFAAYCESQGGKATPKGFNTWLPKQPKWRVAKALVQDQDKILAQRRDLVSQYCDGETIMENRYHAFRRLAPPAVQQEYAALGARLHKPKLKGKKQCY